MPTESGAGARTSRRLPGADDFTQHLYRLLHEHPEGLTRAEIHDALRDGWLETGAYRAYAERLEAKPPRRKGVRHDFGTPEFKAAARMWWISARLAGMTSAGSIRREGTRAPARFFAQRPPRVLGQRPALVPFDPEASRTVLTSTTRDHIREENAKAALLPVLHDRRVSGRTRDQVQAAYDYLSGRR